MTEHVSEDLPRLLTGEATRAQVQAASEHLPGCSDCQQDLVFLLVAHASLSSARRFAPELTRDELPALPDPERLLGGIRSEPKRRSRRILLVAAAVVVLAGATAGGAVLATSGGPAGQRFALAAYGVGSVPAAATFTGDQLHVDATRLPQLPATERYEIWLTDAARIRMQPVGWIDSDGRAVLTVPAQLMRTFTDVEVSIQGLDAASYLYSGRSVLRGAY